MERLALIEILDHDGRVQRSFDVQRWPIRVGRALDNDLVLDDPHLAAHHFSLDQAQVEGGAISVSVGRCINGVQLVATGARQRLAAGASAAWSSGATLRAGQSMLRLRRPEDPLAAEVPLISTRLSARPGWIWLAFLLVLLATAAEVWLESDPGTQWDKYLPPLLEVGLGIPLWALLWGLGSKLFMRRFVIAPYLRFTLVWVLVRMLVDGLLPIASYALSWDWLGEIRPLVDATLVCALLVGHLRLLLPGRERPVLLGGAACTAAILALMVAFSLRLNHRPLFEAYVSILPPPVLRLAPSVPITTLIDDLKPLRASLEQRARDDVESNAGETGFLIGEP